LTEQTHFLPESSLLAYSFKIQKFIMASIVATIILVVMGVTVITVIMVVIFVIVIRVKV
jgi:hypothetical protein